MIGHRVTYQLPDTTALQFGQIVAQVGRDCFIVETIQPWPSTPPAWCGTDVFRSEIVEIEPDALAPLTYGITFDD